MARSSKQIAAQKKAAVASAAKRRKLSANATPESRSKRLIKSAERRSNASVSKAYAAKPKGNLTQTQTKRITSRQDRKNVVDAVHGKSKFGASNVTGKRDPGRQAELKTIRAKAMRAIAKKRKKAK